MIRFFRIAAFLLAVATAPGIGAASAQQSRPQVAQSGPQMMSVGEAHRKAQVGEVVLVDVRTPEEWKETGVATSAHAISMHQEPRAFLKGLDAALGGDRSRPLALICRTGNRTGGLIPELRRLGFTNLVDVGEGMAGSKAGPGWLKAGLPLRKGASVTAPPQVSIPPANQSAAK